MSPGAATAVAARALGRRDWAYLALLWIGGFDLRVTVLAVPPVIPLIHRDLGLSEKEVGVLTGLPLLLLAAAAIPGALLIARLGARRALVAGLGAVALGSALRGAGPGVAVLFAATLVMGAGVAVSQPAFPTLSREWFPARVALATAVYSNGLLVGETAPTSFTGALLLPALHGSWPWSLVVWSLPVLITAGLVLAATPHVEPHPEQAPRRWWPDFRSRQTWQAGLVLGCASAAYFGTNTFVPDFARATHRASLENGALAVLNACQLPASFLVLALAERLVRRRLPFMVSAALILAGTLILVLGPGWALVAAAGLVGFATALALVLTLALPPLLARPADVHRFSAGVFVIAYGLSFAGPLLGGAAWDASGRPAAAFLVLGAGAVLMIGLAATLPLGRAAPAGRGPA